MKDLLLAVVLNAALCVSPISASITCRDRRGTPVDWFVAYKLPHGDRTNELPGSMLLYADSRSSSWSIPEYVNSSGCSVVSTLSQLYKAKASNDLETFYMSYNDEHPDTGKKDSGRGHAKGVAVFDSQSGFWLIHSVPNFPSSMGYTYPLSGLRNGQSFLCISMRTDSIPALAKQMSFIQPSIYDSQLPTSFATRYPSLQAVVAMKPLSKKSTIFYSVESLKTINGEQLTSFAKHKKFHEDLYAELVAPHLKNSFYVETWMNGPGDMPSSCAAPYKVLNVKAVHLGDFAFSSSKDHSKWAVTTTSLAPIVCIGDINRQISQTLRGGSTTCVMNRAVWTLFKNSVMRLEECKTTSKLQKVLDIFLH